MSTKAPIICGRPYVLFDPEQTAEIKRIEAKNDAIMSVVRGLNAALAAVAEFGSEYGADADLIDMLVRQQLAEGTVWALACAVYIGFLVWLGRKLFAKQAEIQRRNAGKTYSYEKESDLGDTLVAYYMLGGFSGIAAFVLFFYGIMHVISPEYYAIREIMDVIGGATR